MSLMQDSSIDDKVMTLWKLYSDNHHVSTSLRDVESMRSSATNLGLMASAAAFGLNEVARLTMRSRKYLKCQFTLYLCSISSNVQAQVAECRILCRCTIPHEPLLLQAGHQRPYRQSLAHPQEP